MATTPASMEVRPPRRRRYRLNKKKLALALLWLGCVAALIVGAAQILEKAGLETVAMDMTGIPKNDAPQGGRSQKPSGADALAGRLIVLDAGHGGFDPGTVGADGAREDEINLAVAQYLKAGLEECGAQVVMTRSDGNALAPTKDEDMAKRREIIAQSGSDIVISIHVNWYTDPDVSGPVAMFMPGSDQGKRLAEAVQQSLNAALGTSGLARSDELFILKSGNQPCVLVECGYISNAKEAAKLGREDHRRAIAEAICEGARDYFS